MKKLVLLLLMLFATLCLTGCSQEDSKTADSFSAGNTAVSVFKKPIQEAGTGDIVTFGRYEQDNDLGNGPEPIDWIVLDVQDGKALLLSKYGLDQKPYNLKEIITTWEDCSMRRWLNSEFLNLAFSAEEQEAILMTEVDNSDAQGFDWTTHNRFIEYNTSGGNNTQDKIFLLSYAEAYRYFGVLYHGLDGVGLNLKASVAPTKYARENGAAIDPSITVDDRYAGWWWLRSPGNKQQLAANIEYEGLLGCRYVDNEWGCVRPAFWLDLKSDIF